MSDKVVKFGMIYIYVLCGLIALQWLIGLFLKDVLIYGDGQKKFIFVWKEEDPYEYYNW